MTSSPGWGRARLALQRLVAITPAPVLGVLRAVVPRGLLGSAAGPALEGWDRPLRGSGTGVAAMVPPTARPRRSAPAAPDGLSVAVVTSSLDAGGMDVFVAFLSRGLRERGAGVVVLIASSVPADDGRLAADLRSEGFDVRSVDARELEVTLGATRFHVASVHGAPGWAVRGLERRGVPIVETVHGMHNLYGAASAEWAARAAALDTVVTLSEMARVEFCRSVPDAPQELVTVIPNGVVSLRLPSALRDAARQALGLGDEFVFVSLARHCPQKNTFGLVAAFEDVAAAVPDALLVVAGRPDDAAYTAQVLALSDRLPCRDRVHVRDQTDRAAVLLAAADCFVLDSFFEGNALASMEAMTAGLPVVLSEVSGAGDQLAAVPSGGALVPNPLGDPYRVTWDAVARARYTRHANRAALVAAMVAVARNRDDWAGRRDEIAGLAEAAFDPGVCLDRHFDVLRSAAGSAGSATAPVADHGRRAG